MPFFFLNPSKLVFVPISLLYEIPASIYSCSLKYNKLLSIIDRAKDRILEIKPLATHCISDFHPRRMIKRCIEEESRRIKTHLLVRKIKEKEKKPAEEVWHVIEDNTILPWSHVHHFHKHGILNVLHQMLFIP